MANGFFRVVDNVDSAGRWYLKAPRNGRGREIDARQFTSGRHVEVPEALMVPVRQPGHPLDFTFAAFDMPVVRREIGQVFEDFARDDIQRVPVMLDSHKSGFEILNVTRVVPCLDEHRSEIMYWTEADGRPDKVGQYRMITRLSVDPARATGFRAFRIDGWKIALVISRELMQELLAREITGVRFEDV